MVTMWEVGEAPQPRAHPPVPQFPPGTLPWSYPPAPGEQAWGLGGGRRAGFSGGELCQGPWVPASSLGPSCWWGRGGPSSGSWGGIKLRRTEIRPCTAYIREGDILCLLLGANSSLRVTPLQFC